MMKHLTDTILEAAISNIDEAKFDSHRLIRELLTRYPQEYARELFEFVNSKDPIQDLHKEIGLSLKKLSCIKANGKVSSLNIRGKMSENEEWIKVVPPQAD